MARVQSLTSSSHSNIEDVKMTPRRVILVEDDPDDRDLFQMFFSSREDISLMPILGNGLELISFLEEIENDHELPDLIVLDQNMPMMNGKQTLSYLKQHKRYAEIPAVIYSTYTDTNLIADCKTLGARIVASKPIDHDGYQKMMDDFLDVIETKRS
jgi:CheY-like chemotaxis protein